MSAIYVGLNVLKCTADEAYQMLFETQVYRHNILLDFHIVYYSFRSKVPMTLYLTYMSWFDLRKLWDPCDGFRRLGLVHFYINASI